MWYLNWKQESSQLKLTNIELQCIDVAMILFNSYYKELKFNDMCKFTEVFGKLDKIEYKFTSVLKYFMIQIMSEESRKKV